MMFCLVGCAEERFEAAPRITRGEFPFVFEYELNGERFLIEDTIVCEFEGYDIYTNSFATFGYPYSRRWDMSLENGSDEKRVLIRFEDNSRSVFKKRQINTYSWVSVYFGSADYYMGESDSSKWYPCISYFEEYVVIPRYLSNTKSTELTNEQLEELFGIKIIRFEFSEPIENTFDIEVNSIEEASEYPKE